MVKVFTFGKGAVLVKGCWISGYVELKQIEPPLNYLGRIKKEDFEHLNTKEELYSMRIEGSLLKELKKQLINMSGSNILIFDEFILDFTDYNDKSMEVLKNAIDTALRGCSQITLAC